MPIDSPCRHTAERLEAAFWSRTSPRAEDSTHAATCPGCGELMKGLEAIADSLAAHSLPLLSVDRARSIRQLASRELAGSSVATKPVASHPLRSGELPNGYSRELVRILAWALLPLPLVLFVYVQAFQIGGALLGRVLPDWAVLAVGIAAVSGAASWLAVVYGSIPLVAYRCLSRIDDSTPPLTRVSP
jgi:hypothetical protein